VTGKQKTLLLTLYALIVALRSPTLLIHGRIFAEEGPVYFRSAWMSSGLQALLVPHLGYYSLWANLCGVLATLSLEHAAVVFVCCAFAAQLLAGYLVLECEAFEGFASKALALAVLLLASNLEVWLNTINSQFYFAICAAVIFVSQAGQLRLARNAALLLGGLTGPFVASLAPLFVVRAFLQKSKDAVVQASLLMACAVVQAVAVLTQLHSGERQLVFQPKGIAPILLVRYLIPTFFSKLGETASAVVILGQPSRFWGASYLASAIQLAAHSGVAAGGCWMDSPPRVDLSEQHLEATIAHSWMDGRVRHVRRSRWNSARL